MHTKSEPAFIKNRLLPRWLWFKREILNMFYYDRVVYPQPGLEETTYINYQPPATREKVPQKYWYMLGLENHKVHLSNIHGLLKTRKIEFIICGFLKREEVGMFKELGIENICNVSELIWLKGISYDEIILPGDGHLNAYGHRLFAEHLYESIETFLN